MGESPALSTLDFPSITVLPVFDRIGRSGETPGPAEPPSVFDFSPKLPEWYLLTNPDGARDAPPVPWSFSLIACAKYAYRPLPRCCLTLLTGTQDFWRSYLALLCSGQHSLRQSHRMCLPPVPWTVRPVMCRSVCRVLFRATGWPRGPFPVGDFAFGHASGQVVISAVQHIVHRITIIHLVNMDSLYTTPGFWSGLALWSLLTF